MPPDSPRTNESAAPAAVEVSGLQCGFDGTVVLSDVSFTVRRGEVYFIIGGSGCGKTTLLRHMAGLQEPMAGSVRFGEGAAGRPRFGMLFQSGALWSSMTVRQNVALPLEEHTALSRREIDRIVLFRLAQVGLTGYEDHYPAEISGGMKKRAGLARALALDPGIVLLDEPSAGLDPVSARGLDRLILQLRDTFGTTMVIVSHDLDSIFGIADRVLMLDRTARGPIAEGRPADLAAGSGPVAAAEFLTLRTVPPA